MSTPGPITVPEMAGIIRKAINCFLPGITDLPYGGAFEMAAPSTGQRFRVVVTEVPANPDGGSTEGAEAA